MNPGQLQLLQTIFAVKNQALLSTSVHSLPSASLINEFYNQVINEVNIEVTNREKNWRISNAYFLWVINAEKMRA